MGSMVARTRADARWRRVGLRAARTMRVAPSRPLLDVRLDAREGVAIRRRNDSRPEGDGLGTVYLTRSRAAPQRHLLAFGERGDAPVVR